MPSSSRRMDLKTTMGKTSQEIQDLFKEEFPYPLGWCSGDGWVEVNFHDRTDNLLEFVEYAYQCGREHALEKLTPHFTKDGDLLE